MVFAWECRVYVKNHSGKTKTVGALPVSLPNSVPQLPSGWTLNGRSFTIDKVTLNSGDEVSETGVVYTYSGDMKPSAPNVATLQVY